MRKRLLGLTALAIGIALFFTLRGVSNPAPSHGAEVGSSTFVAPLTAGEGRADLARWLAQLFSVRSPAGPVQGAVLVVSAGGSNVVALESDLLGTCLWSVPPTLGHHGELSLEVRASGFTTLQVKFRLGDEVECILVPMVDERPSYAAKLTIRDYSGQPVAGVRVTLAPCDIRGNRMEERLKICETDRAGFAAVSGLVAPLQRLELEGGQWWNFCSPPQVSGAAVTGLYFKPEDCEAGIDFVVSQVAALGFVDDVGVLAGFAMVPISEFQDSFVSRRHFEHKQQLGRDFPGAWIEVVLPTNGRELEQTYRFYGFSEDGYFEKDLKPELAQTFTPQNLSIESDGRGTGSFELELLDPSGRTISFSEPLARCRFIETGKPKLSFDYVDGGLVLPTGAYKIRGLTRAARWALSSYQANGPSPLLFEIGRGSKVTRSIVLDHQLRVCEVTLIDAGDPFTGTVNVGWTGGPVFARYVGRDGYLKEVLPNLRECTIAGRDRSGRVIKATFTPEIMGNLEGAATLKAVVLMEK